MGLYRIQFIGHIKEKNSLSLSVNEPLRRPLSQTWKTRTPRSRMRQPASAVCACVCVCVCDLCLQEDETFAGSNFTLCVIIYCSGNFLEKCNKMM